MTKTITQHEELNEAIGCYEDELTDLRKNKTMTVEQKVNVLKEMGTMLNQEKAFLYQS